MNNFQSILKLVEQFPNDQELGEKVREIYWQEKARTTTTTTTQLSIFEDIDSVAGRGID